MARLREPITEIIHELVMSGFDGQIQPGEEIGLWTFNEETYTRPFHPRHWDPLANALLAQETAGFVNRQIFAGRTRMDRLMRDLLQATRQSKHVTVLLMSDGEEAILGTPYDKSLNEIYRERRRELHKAKVPFVTILSVRDGAFSGWGVHAGAAPITLNEIDLAEHIVKPPAEKPETKEKATHAPPTPERAAASTETKPNEPTVAAASQPAPTVSSPTTAVEKPAEPLAPPPEPREQSPPPTPLIALPPATQPEPNSATAAEPKPREQQIPPARATLPPVVLQKPTVAPAPAPTSKPAATPPVIESEKAVAEALAQRITSDLTVREHTSDEGINNESASPAGRATEQKEGLKPPESSAATEAMLTPPQAPARSRRGLVLLSISGVVVAGALALLFLRKPRHYQPSLISKSYDRDLKK